MLYLLKFRGIARPCLKRAYSNTNIYQKYKYSATNLKNLGKNDLKGFFQKIEYVLSDADGVQWLHELPIPGSVETFNWLQACGKKCFIVTNNSTKNRRLLFDKACEMGFVLKETQIICTSYATAKYLEKINFKKQAYVIGTEDFTEELKSFGIQCSFKEHDPAFGTLKDLREKIVFAKDVGAVLVGFDYHFTYPKLTKAAKYLLEKDCLFIATSLDEWAPTPTDVKLPGTAAMVRAINACFPQRKPIVIGKPTAEFITLFLGTDVKPENTIMVGDTGITDIVLGHNCGFYTLFVLSGSGTMEQLQQWQESNDSEIRKRIPDFYLNRFGELRELLSD